MLQVTSLDKLKQMAHGEVIELPGFVENEPFIVRAKRPSILSLASEGAIPNNLLGLAKELFMNGLNDKNKSDLKEINTVLKVIAETSLVEPTYKDLKEIGLTLTDIQLLALYNYTQQGVKALESFRPEPTDNKDTESK